MLAERMKLKEMDMIVLIFWPHSIRHFEESSSNHSHHDGTLTYKRIEGDQNGEDPQKREE
jgi:hypothetical protein